MGELSDEVVVDLENFGIVAKCRGKTYPISGTGALPKGFKHCTYTIPDEERSDEGINQIYVIFRNGKLEGALGFATPLSEVPTEHLLDLDFTSVVDGGNPNPYSTDFSYHIIDARIWSPGSVRIDEQIQAALFESIPPYMSKQDQAMKAIGDVLGKLCTEF